MIEKIYSNAIAQRGNKPKLSAYQISNFRLLRALESTLSTKDAIGTRMKKITLFGL